MKKIIVNVMGIKVGEYETKKEITLESVLKGIRGFKKEMDDLGVSCKVSKPKMVEVKE